MEKRKQELKPAKPGFQLLYTSEQINMINALQRLWTNISLWTRAVIESFVYNLPNLKAVTDKLFSQPMNFYDILAFYHGAENARAFVDLLTSFITFSVKTAESMRNGDQEQVSSNMEQWYQTADQLVQFLCSINIYWNASQWGNLLYQYIQMKAEEFTAAINGDFSRGIELYDSMKELTFIMGSYMARGIIAMSQYQYGYQSNERG